MDRTTLSRASFLGIAGTAAAAAVLPHAAAAATLRYGARGRAVRALTVRLAGLGYLPPATVSERYDAATLHAVTAFQKHEQLRVDGIAGPRTLAALETAERPQPAAGGPARRIDVSLRRQVALLVERGDVRRVVAVSTGRTGYETPRGRFAVYRRERRSWSVPYSVWLPWAAYFRGGIAFHGHADVPAYPASHGCVRVPQPFAHEVYSFARLRTPVVVS